MVARALTCHYASLTRDERPITWPVTPYVNDDRRSVDVSTGLAYPAKAERARRNPNVGLLFQDAVGLTLKAHRPSWSLGRPRCETPTSRRTRTAPRAFPPQDSGRHPTGALVRPRGSILVLDSHVDRGHAGEDHVVAAQKVGPPPSSLGGRWDRAEEVGPSPPRRTPGPWQKIGGGTWPDHATLDRAHRQSLPHFRPRRPAWQAVPQIRRSTGCCARDI